MFGIIAFVWLIVAGITLKHIIQRKDIPNNKKWVWVLICLLPLIGLLIYGVVHFKQEKKILVSTILAVLVSATSIWYYTIYEPEAKLNNNNKKAEQVASANSIIQAYQSNEEAAIKKYNNKVIEVTGVVEKQEADANGNTVFLSTGIASTAISARLANKSTTVTAGSTITIKGLCTGYIMGEVQLSEAVVTQNNAAAAPTTTTNPKQDTATAKKTQPTTTSTVDTSKKAQATTEVTFRSKSGSINFKATDEVAATNTQVISTLTDKGAVGFGVLIKGFRFEEALMQQHFNEDKYMDSDKFPKASFTGTITNISAINFKKDGTYAATVKGKLTIHGVTKDVQASGNIIVAAGKLSLNSTFKIKIADYGINATDVAEAAEIIVSCSY